MPPSFNEADVSDKPAVIRNRPRFRPGRIAAIGEMYSQRLESLLGVDDGSRRSSPACGRPASFPTR